MPGSRALSGRTGGSPATPALSATSAAAGEVLFGPLRRHLDGYAALSFVRNVEVVPARLGSDAGLVAAAAAAAQLLTA